MKLDLVRLVDALYPDSKENTKVKEKVLRIVNHYSEYQKKYRLDHRKQISENRKIYNLAHKEYLRERARQYYLEHRDKYRERNMKYRLAHKKGPQTDKRQEGDLK
jgi:hypothetical protein